MGAALVTWALEVPIKAPTPYMEIRARLLLVALANEAHDKHNPPWAVADRKRRAALLATPHQTEVSRVTHVLVDNDLIRKTATYSDGRRAANNRGRWLVRGPLGWE